MSAPNFTTAYDAAVSALAAAGARALLLSESQDPEVAGLTIEVFADGSLNVTLLNGQTIPVGGYSL